MFSISHPRQGGREGGRVFSISHPRQGGRVFSISHPRQGGREGGRVFSISHPVIYQYSKGERGGDRWTQTFDLMLHCSPSSKHFLYIPLTTRGQSIAALWSYGSKSRVLQLSYFCC